jgi:predicted acetyltransferase
VDDDPACVLGTYDNEDDCEIYFVATEAEHRGKGLARRVLHQALLEARERGMRISNLQATKMGYPVYARLGYDPICTLEMWERRK